MFKLTGANLPTQKSALPRTVPIFRLYQDQPRLLSPVARIRSSTSIVETGDIEVEMAQPDLFGVHAVAQLPFSLQKVTRIAAGFGELSILSSPLGVGPFGAWLNGSAIHAYLPKEYCNPTAQMTLEGVATVRVPTPENDGTFLFDLSTWDTFTLTQIWIDGALFRPAANPSSPIAGEFTKTGGSVRLYPPVSTPPAPFSIAELAVSTALVFDGVANIATFDFSESEMVTLEAVDYLGLHFTTPIDVLEPQVREFYWLRPYATLFLPLSMQLTAKKMVAEGVTSAISSLTYPSGL